MKVSIVIPAHNEEALLPACLRALLAQDYDGPLEIIVVDNASSDHTAEVARSLGVCVVPEPRRDYCLALIRGFAAATGSIIAMTDADTVVPPDWVSRLVEEYRRRPDVVAIGGDVVFTGANWKGWLLARVLVPAFNWIDRRNPRGPHLWGANLSVRRDAFLAVGGWNPKFSLQADMIQKRVFWEFATHYIHHHKDQKWTPQSFGRNFQLTDAEWGDVRSIMANRKVAITDSVWQADRDFMVRQAREELANLTLSPLERYKIVVEDDSQLQASLDLFPRASKLMSMAGDAAVPQQHRH